MTVNKPVVVGAGATLAGAGMLAIAYYYVPWQTGAAWAEGDEKRASMLADYAFSLRDYAMLFGLLVFGGLALMASAAEL
jgi:hypothetical protein